MFETLAAEASYKGFESTHGSMTMKLRQTSAFDVYYPTGYDRQACAALVFIFSPRDIIMTSRARDRVGIPCAGHIPR